MAEVTNKVPAVCKWFSDEKGFGFLVCDGITGSDIFVHKEQLQKSNVPSLKEGDKVYCIVHKGQKGLSAIDIELA